jgi:hypothetical protein
MNAQRAREEIVNLQVVVMGSSKNLMITVEVL